MKQYFTLVIASVFGLCLLWFALVVFQYQTSDELHDLRVEQQELENDRYGIFTEKIDSVGDKIVESVAYGFLGIACAITFFSFATAFSLWYTFSIRLYRWANIEPLSISSIANQVHGLLPEPIDPEVITLKPIRIDSGKKSEHVIFAQEGVPQTRQAVTDVKLRLPNNETIKRDLFSLFLFRTFDRGTMPTRKKWVSSKQMTREQFDGVMQLLEQANLWVDRRRGYAGKATVESSNLARERIDIYLPEIDDFGKQEL